MEENKLEEDDVVRVTGTSWEGIEGRVVIVREGMADKRPAARPIQRRAKVLLEIQKGPMRRQLWFPQDLVEKIVGAPLDLGAEEAEPPKDEEE